MLSLGQGAHHCLHDGRTNGIAEEAYAIAPSTHFESKALIKAHRPLELRNLEHAQHGDVAPPRDKPESVERRQGADRAVERVPAAGTVRPIVHDQKRRSAAQCRDRPPSAFQRGSGPLPIVKRRGLPYAFRIQYFAARPDRPHGRCYSVGQAFTVAQQEQSPPCLGHTEGGGIHDLWAEQNIRARSARR
jgi:hypothetical protein